MPKCLLKTLIFWQYASKLITLIVFAVDLILTLSYNIIFGKKNHLNNLTLRSEYSEENNIQELNTRSFLRELVSHINNFSSDLLPKQSKQLRKKNVQQFSYKVNLNLNIC